MYKFIFYFLFSLCLFHLTTYAEEIIEWQDCVKVAAKNNPDLISAVENVSQQKAAKNITASTLYPQVSANLNAATAKTSTTSSLTGKTTSSTSDSYSYGVSGSQLIFDGFTTINNVKAASQNIQAARENYRFTSTQIRLNLRTAFVNLLTAQQMVKVSEEIVKIRRDNLMLITLRYQSGLEHKGALLKAEADLAQARFQLSQAKRDIELAETQLNKQMGRHEFKPIIAKGDFTVVSDTKEKPDFDALIKDNPSVLQAIAKKNSAEFSIKSVYGSFLPQITGSAGANKSDTHWSPQNDQWNLGLKVSMPIFEGGLRLAQLKQAQAVYNQAVANEKSIKDTAIVNLEQTWVNLRDAIETVGVQAKSLEASEERSKIAQAQYSTGFISFDNWIIIEDDLVRAKTAYLEAEANVLLAEANWIQAKGETLEYAQQKN